MSLVNVAIVGATGMVGRMFIRVLEERNFPVGKIHLLASKRSAGQKLRFKDTDYTIEELTEESFNRPAGIALFSAGGDISKKFVPIAQKKGWICVDNSSTFRMEPDVPLVVPEVNPQDVNWHKGIIANPNCSTIQAMVVLKPLMDKYGLKRVIYSTYQAVSGAGMEGTMDLVRGQKGEAPKKFQHQIAGNLIPQIDVFTENGYTKEEMKMVDETKKILGNQDLKVTATCVRVPVANGHSESINIELASPYELNDVVKLLQEAHGVVVVDEPSKNIYPMPLPITGTNDVYVGRIRRDFSAENSLNLWVVADNIRKGAALNAVQVAELLLDKK